MVLLGDDWVRGINRGPGGAVKGTKALSALLGRRGGVENADGSEEVEEEELDSGFEEERGVSGMDGDSW